MAVMLLAAATTPVSAKGCLKGAVVGGVAGHYAGHHGAIGANLLLSISGLSLCYLNCNALPSPFRHVPDWPKLRRS
jgi:hypothetical protein